MEQLVCWQCGESLKDIPQPFTRLEQCRHCHAELHVCLMCRFYNPRLSDKCDHEMAERAREANIANFCDYYKPRLDAFNQNKKSSSDDAMQKLRDLFGGADSAKPEPGSADSVEEVRNRFDDLFKK